MEWLATHTLVTPALVLSVGLYVFFLKRIDLERWGMLLVIGLNVLVTLPLRCSSCDHGCGNSMISTSACRSLKLSDRQRRQVEWPWLKSSVVGLCPVHGAGDGGCGDFFHFW
ncbi:MAG: hypothetical protein R3E89_07150 [Thiolinea sp.]